MRRSRPIPRPRRGHSGWLRLTLLSSLAAALVAFFPAAAVAAGGQTALADPAFVSYARSIGAGRPATSLGFVPSPVDLAGVPAARFAPLMMRFPARFLSASAGADAAGQQAVAPASYDLGVLGELSPVRDQGRYGTCWAFAAIASLESCLLPGEAADFSENNLAAHAGFALGFDDGGNSYMAMAYLVRWAGPVSEADDPYAPYASTPNASPSGAQVRKHVQEVLELPPRTSATDTTNLKWAITTYGAVDTTMFWSDGAYRASAAVYYYQGSGANHAVACVGWDDAFPAASFATRPPGNGAFLVRNSWGTSFGHNGYFWVSYYDGAFAGQSTVFDDAEPVTGSDRIYQNDPLGWVASYRPPNAPDASTAWLANVFTAPEADELAGAGFYTTAPNASYEVRVASTMDGVHDAAASARGTIAVPGYHTVPLTSSVPLRAGQNVVIAVRLTVPGYKFPVAIEEPYRGYSNATASAGQSYVSADGSTWTDMTSLIADTNVCLKGYARIASPQPPPDPVPSVSPTPSASPAPSASPTPSTSPTPAPTPAQRAPSVRLRGMASRPGAIARIAYRLTGAGQGHGTVTVSLRLFSSRGTVIGHLRLEGVTMERSHLWRVRSPLIRGSYRIVAVAGFDAGPASRPATAILRVR
ncbi:MAG TPA: lectin like domain-containing protein [Thermoleophilia bacterium]|nr:lectin like domain-containing protein [Thermoleophilia bacterium]